MYKRDRAIALLVVIVAAAVAIGFENCSNSIGFKNNQLTGVGNPFNPPASQAVLKSVCNLLTQCNSGLTESVCEVGVANSTSMVSALGASTATYTSFGSLLTAETLGVVSPNSYSANSCEISLGTLTCGSPGVAGAYVSGSQTPFVDVGQMLPTSSCPGVFSPSNYSVFLAVTSTTASYVEKFQFNSASNTLAPITSYLTTITSTPALRSLALGTDGNLYLGMGLLALKPNSEDVVDPGSMVSVGSYTFSGGPTGQAVGNAFGQCVLPNGNFVIGEELAGAGVNNVDEYDTSGNYVLTVLSNLIQAYNQPAMPSCLALSNTQVLIVEVDLANPGGAGGVTYVTIGTSTMSFNLTNPWGFTLGSDSNLYFLLNNSGSQPGSSQVESCPLQNILTGTRSQLGICSEINPQPPASGFPMTARASVAIPFTPNSLYFSNGAAYVYNPVTLALTQVYDLTTIVLPGNDSIKASWSAVIK